MPTDNKKTKERSERELGLLGSIGEDDLKVISQALRILLDTKSTWLVNLFKFAASVRSAELANFYNEPRMSFEHRGTNGWSEIWFDGKARTKIYDSITKFIRKIPVDLYGILTSMGIRGRTAREIQKNRRLDVK